MHLILGQIRLHSSGKSITYQQQKTIKPSVDFKWFNGAQPRLLVFGVHSSEPDVGNCRVWQGKRDADPLEPKGDTRAFRLWLLTIQYMQDLATNFFLS